jgi:hypothetical protein
LSVDPKKTYLIYGVTVLLLFGVVAQLQGPIRWTREAEGLTHPEMLVESAPNDAMLLLLGGFRAIAVDLIWVSAMNAQEEGKWHEIHMFMQLITRLQPHFAEAYIFNAWNQAYNISHETESPEEKWGWVMAGYNFLRQGVRRNPHLYEVKFWAGWLLFDKIAQNLDAEQRIDFTRRYMAENDGRHPLRDAGIWFERAYKTPSSQLLAHRMMMAHAYTRLAEFHYLRDDEERMRASLIRAFQHVEEIRQQYPDETSTQELVRCWTVYGKLRAQTRAAQAWIPAKTEQAIQALEQIFEGWEREFKGNPYGLVINNERARVGRILADDAIKRLQSKERACKYLEKAYLSLRRLATRYKEVKDLSSQVEEAAALLKEHGCRSPEEVWEKDKES